MSLTQDEIKKQIEIFKKGSVDFITPKELGEKLKKKSVLTIKAGFDPSRPDLHLGHAVLLNKLRDFQKQGHKVVFLLGDFTAAIGDPTGRDEMRPLLTRKEIEANTQTYMDQAFKILDSNTTILEKNSNWLSKMSTYDFITLSSKYTVARTLERDDFKKRYSENRPISMHEFLYPLVQGYDSVSLKADVELGGTDQKFNLLVGRDLQKAYNQEIQCVITVPILEGLDGKQKMSKSLGNHISFLDSPKDMFGKIMRITDDMMWRYYELLTNLSLVEISDLKDKVNSGEFHPKKIKVDLAKKLVTQFHNVGRANSAEAEFETIFVNKGLPNSIPEFEISKNEDDLSFRNILVLSGICASRSEVARLIKDGALCFMDTEGTNKVKVKKVNEDLNFVNSNEIVVQLGKKKFIKVIKL